MIIATLALHALFQVSPPRPPQQSVVRDSVRADSIGRFTRTRLPVTAEVLATAFKDSRARELFVRARTARIAQDSSLHSYDAKVLQRISVRGSIGSSGPERLAYRAESAARVRWQRDVGAYIDVTGERATIPLLGSPKVERDLARDQATDAAFSPVPYFPGSESLWIGELTAGIDVNDQQLVNMLAVGAEAYYTYATGDSVSFDIGEGRVFQLRELEVRPREPKWNLAVGSLWFDIASGQLVRAAYRLAAPTQSAVGVSGDDSASKAQKLTLFVIQGMLSPNRGEVSAISVEYGLYEGRFWLPRLQSADGYVQAMFARVPVKWENAFDYQSVNKPLGLEPITSLNEPGGGLPARQPPAGLDAAGRQRYRDSVRAMYDAAAKAREDSNRRGIPRGSMRQCDTASRRVVTQGRADGAMTVQITVPCNIDSLINSPDLPKSAYGDAEDVFGSKERDKLISDALSLAAQAPFALFDLPRPQLEFGPSMMRYNRVEGFSWGVKIDQQIGAGLFATGSARYGFADHKPNFEFAIGRTNLTKTIRLNGYTRLVASNDWGNPLSFGSGMAALLFGRDEGFYYRARGAELTWTQSRDRRLELRAFTEQQSSAIQNTSTSLGGHFEPNITALKGQFTGLSLRAQRMWGLDPKGFRTLADVRVEGARSDSAYGRAALDVTFSRGLFGNLSAALTLAGGSSVGALPPQRQWFMGGTQTVRGERADTAHSGNAFWLGRAELARQMPGVRLSLFGDIGWAGDRTLFSDPGRPMSGVGIGLSGFDGLIRFDIARGLFPREQTRFGLYLGARY